VTRRRVSANNIDVGATRVAALRNAPGNARDANSNGWRWQQTPLDNGALPLRNGRASRDAARDETRRTMRLRFA
jgi:hypothetical protein